MIEAILKRERERNEILLAKYMEELYMLPKGKIVSKKQQERTYYYLKFRNGDKIQTIYLGKNSKIIEETEEKLQRRKFIEKIIKEIKAENQKIVKLESKL